MFKGTDYHVFSYLFLDMRKKRVLYTTYKNLFGHFYNQSFIRVII